MNAKSVPIVEVIQRYSAIELKPRGRELWGLCPFHSEKTPSFAVNPSKNVWHCYGGCGGGSAVDFVMKLQRKTFVEACKQIESDFGLRRDNIRHVRKSAEQSAAQVEAELDRYIQRVFDECYKYAILCGRILRERFPSPVLNEDENTLAMLVLDRDLFQKVTELIASNEADEVVLGLKMYRRRCGGGGFGGGNHASGL